MALANFSDYTFLVYDRCGYMRSMHVVIKNGALLVHAATGAYARPYSPLRRGPIPTFTTNARP